VRALGEYAVAGGAAPDAAALVNGFFRKLEEFDLPLYRAVKDGAPIDGPASEARLQEAADALAALIATVPEDVLVRSRAIIDKVKGRSGGSSGVGGGGGAPQQPQSAEDAELLNELLTVWE
jgi:hypothetical protein